MTTTKTPAAKPSAQEAHRAAIAATAEAQAALQPARDKLEAAQQALAVANSEAICAVTVKCPDPQAALERIEKSRAAVKQAEDDVRWRVLELHAAEAQHEEAHTREQAARRAVTVAEYVVAHQEWNDPDSRENQLLSQLTNTIAELIPMICDRKDLHDQLSREWAHVPVEERPVLKAGKPITATSTRFVVGHIGDLAPEVVESLKAGTAAAVVELAERERARRFG